MVCDLRDRVDRLRFALVVVFEIPRHDVDDQCDERGEYERGGKTTPARVKVAAFREVNLLKNDDGSLVRDENGRGVYGETGKIVYGVKYSNMDALKLRNEDDGMYPMSIRLWTKIVELSA